MLLIITISTFTITQQQMEQIRQSQAGCSNPLTDEQILSQVLGERRGHNRGRGRKLPIAASIPNYQPPKERVYTQREVDEMMRNRDATNNANFGILFDALKRANFDIPDFQPVSSPMNVTEDDDVDEDDLDDDDDDDAY